MLSARCWAQTLPPQAQRQGSSSALKGVVPRSSAWLSQAGQQEGGLWEVPVPLWYQGKTRLSSRASCAVVPHRGVSVAEGHVKDLEVQLWI